MKAFIDSKRCAAQTTICNPLVECPQKAIRYMEDEELPLGGKMEIDESKCNGCGHCTQICCGHCIVLK